MGPRLRPHPSVQSLHHAARPDHQPLPADQRDSEPGPAHLPVADQTPGHRGYPQPDQDDFLEFIEDFGDFKEDIAGKMGNLTCVLTELKYLTEDLKLNIDYYTAPASEIDGFVLEESFAKDPEWSKKLADGYSDCYKISENFPQTALNRNPLTKIFGRHMIFFRCANRNEKRMCAQGQMLKYLEAMYGKDDSKKPSEFGLPDDKYDAAAVSIMVMQNAATSEEEFVGNFFWGEMGM